METDSKVMYCPNCRKEQETRDKQCFVTYIVARKKIKIGSPGLVCKVCDSFVWFERPSKTSKELSDLLAKAAAMPTGREVLLFIAWVIVCVVIGAIMAYNGLL